MSYKKQGYIWNWERLICSPAEVILRHKNSDFNQNDV